MSEANKQEAGPLGLASTAVLGPLPERAVFDRWLRDNGHCEDQHDDMLMPLQRSLNELMWSAWKGAVAAERERWELAVHTVLADWNRWDEVTAHEIRRLALKA